MDYQNNNSINNMNNNPHKNMGLSANSGYYETNLNTNKFSENSVSSPNEGVGVGNQNMNDYSSNAAIGKSNANMNNYSLNAGNGNIGQNNNNLPMSTSRQKFNNSLKKTFTKIESFADKLYQKFENMKNKRSARRNGNMGNSNSLGGHTNTYPNENNGYPPVQPIVPPHTSAQQPTMTTQVKPSFKTRMRRWFS